MNAEKLLTENSSRKGPQASRAEMTDRLLTIEADTFATNFNRHPFTVSHQLASHPLFSLPGLLALSQRLPPENVKYNSGEVHVDTGLFCGPHNGLSIEQTLRQIESCRSWMVLKFIERDSEFGPLVQQLLDEVQRFSEPISPGMTRREAFIFISSASSVTPFHIDPEINFLLQIRGRKLMNIFDGADRSLLPETDLERFYSQGYYQIAFREEFQQRARVFELTPGVGVHLPVTAPHWVQNGDDVSISLSITFRTPASERRADLYCSHAWLRDRGMSPTPVGQSRWRDALSLHTYRAVRNTRAWLTKKNELTVRY